MIVGLIAAAVAPKKVRVSAEYEKIANQISFFINKCAYCIRFSDSTHIISQKRVSLITRLYLLLPWRGSKRI